MEVIRISWHSAYKEVGTSRILIPQTVDTRNDVRGAVCILQESNEEIFIPLDQFTSLKYVKVV